MSLPLFGCSSLSRPEEILIAAEPVAAAAKPAMAAPAAPERAPSQANAPIPPPAAAGG